MNIKDAWIKPIARPLLRKVVHMCSDYFTEDSCGKHQELKQRLLGGNLNYLILNFICSLVASFQETKTSMIESVFNKVASCRIQHK